MATSTEITHAEETTPIVGGGPAPDTKGKQPMVVDSPPRHINPNQVSEAASSAVSMEARLIAIREAEKKIIRPRPVAAPLPWWRRLAYLLFPPDPLSGIRAGQPLDAKQHEMLTKVISRPMKPWCPERLALERELVTECLLYYNSKNQGNEYEPAPGMVTQHFQFDKGTCWTHGNFVARRKRYGCFSFLPAPRTLFFFELACRHGFDGVVTCTPLGEPVTEAYSVKGFPLWWSTRRTGDSDVICASCHARFRQPSIKKESACAHPKFGGVCQMCFEKSPVLHPNPGEFAFGC